MASISFNGNEVEDPASSRDAGSTDYIYIQCNQALSNEHKRQLVGLHVMIQEYIGANAYLCRYEPVDLDTIRSLSFVDRANVYHKTFKTTSSLESIIGRNDDSSKKFTVDILLHKDSVDAAQVASDLFTKAGVDPNSVSVQHRKIRATLSANAIRDVESVDSIKTIEEVKPIALANNFARKDMQAEGPSLNNMTLQGSNQVVAIADSGFDTGHKTDVHPAFQGRVLALISMTSRPSASDPIGHGTHVAGSILGDGMAPHMGGSIQGTAPKATLVVQSLLNQQGEMETPPNLWDLLIGPYSNHNARIHSDSWGQDWNSNPYQVPYDANASALDRFVWHNPDCVVCFAAGNDAEKHDAGTAQITSSGAAKNCITVGACQSSRPSLNYVYSPGKAMPNDSSIIAGFSSRGPTFEGRIKPDVVAPGTAILSAASRDPAISRETRDHFGHSDDPFWIFDSGTSMATPLVAGCAAVLRQGVLAAGHLEPSAALIKALLINGATNLQGKSEPNRRYVTAPSFTKGFGHVNLDESFVIPGKTPLEGFEDSKQTLSQGQKWETKVVIPDRPSEDSQKSLKVTLVYTDRPGAAIQNNMTLTVTSANGTKKRGDEGYAVENNVEQVDWLNPPSGTARITVFAERITRPDDAQTFALVWRVV